MKKIIIALGSLFGLAVLLLAGTLAWVLTFDPNENKDWIAQKFQESTGRTLTLGGDVGLTLYPWLGVTVNDITVGNSPGFSDAPLLQAEHAQVRIKLLPLLNGSYEIDTVRLHGANISLEVLGNGQANWADPDAEPAVLEEESSGSSTALLDKLIIGGVDIQNLNLVYDDQFANAHHEISNLNASIGELVYGEPLDIRLDLDTASRSPELATAIALTGTVIYDLDNGRYDLEPLQLDATLRGPNVPNGSADLSLSTALNVDLDNDTLVLRDLDFTALGARLSAGLTASRIATDTPAVQANLNLSGTDLAVVFRILEQPELARRVASLSNNYSVAASVDADLRTGTLTLPTLDISLLGADISGNLLGNRINSDSPALSGRLAASGPDLPTLIEVLGILQGGSNTGLAQYGRELGRVPDKAFRIESNFTVDLQSGGLEVPELYAGLFGATITGNVNGSRINTDTPQLRGELNAQGPDLPLLLQIAGQLQGDQDSALNQYGIQLRSMRNRAFTLATSFEADLQRGDIQLPMLNAAMLGLRLNGRLDARNMEAANGSIDGALQLQGENLRELLTALDQAGLGEVAQSLNLDVQVSGTRNDLRINPLNASLVVAGGQVGNTPQTLSLSANTQMNLGNDSLRIDAFTLSGLGLDLKGAISATDLSGNMAYNGQMEMPAFNARRLMTQLNLEVPDTADDTVLQSVGLATALNGTANSLNLDNLALKLDDSNITGSLAVSDFTTQGTRFTFNVDRIDADRYLAPSAEDSPATAAGPAEPLPVDTLKALDVDGTLNIGALTVSGLNMSDIVLQVSANDGNLALNPFQANLYDGSFNGDIRLDVNAAQPTASVATTLSSINLGPLLQDFMDATYLSGTGNIELSLSGTGADSAAIQRNLNGSGSLALEDGVLTGVDVQAVLRSIETMIRSRQLATIPQGGQTPFESFSATLAVDEGVVNSQDLLIKAPGWQVNGAGTLADLGNNRIDFNLVTAVDRTTASDTQQYDLGGYTLPIACTGALDSPRCLPDAQQIIAASVTNAVQRRLGEFLQDRLGTQQQPAQTETNELAPTTESTEEAAAPAEPEPVEQQPAEPAQELLNRALDRLLR